MERNSYTGPVDDTTLFDEKDGRVWLRRLCGMTCGNDGEDTGPAMTRGLAIVVTSDGRFEGSDWKVVESGFDSQCARVVWTAADGGLRLESVWSFCASTGVVSRKDRLVNVGDAALTVFRLQARFAFPPARYEVYAQSSQWCNENQGAWLPLHAGGLRFGCVRGRTTQGGTPYLGFREVGSDRGVAFHVLPCGNWAIDVAARAVMDGCPMAVVSLGLAADDLRLRVEPGEATECPEILIQALPGGEPRRAAPRLHQWFRQRAGASERAELPVVFNTWFDQFEVLDVPRLRRQLQAAKEVGCEVFVIDAGWYGPQAGDWFAQAGDWREKLDGAFRGEMSGFADEVRAAGLGFGLWMEPERFGPNVPIRSEHPEWFCGTESEFARIDLTIAAAYEYLRDEISRLVDAYQLAWMKVDFNFDLGRDLSGAELSGYYQAWYRLLDEIRAKHPQTVFEGCSSGAMRLDLASVSHCDAHFLSDTVNPVDVVRIGEAALLRLPPGQLTRWAVLRSAGQAIPRYTKSLADSPAAILTPCGPLWEPCELAEVDFIVAAALPGVFGLGGDLTGLPEEAIARLRDHVGFVKRWRGAIRRSDAELLTPTGRKADRQGWAALQLNDPESGAALLFVYRLDDGATAKRFVVQGIDAGATYEISWHIPAGREAKTVGGGELMSGGIEVALPARRQAAVLVIQPITSR